jgi:hypothetical protein
MDLSQKFTPKTQAPLRGGEAGIWMSGYPQEVADAIAAGSGPSVPDSTTGIPQPGTIVPGQLVQLNANGNFDLAAQVNLSSAMPALYFVVFSGDKDFSGSFVGKINCCHGGMRYVTTAFDAGTYTPGAPLVPSATVPGNLAPKGVGQRPHPGRGLRGHERRRRDRRDARRGHGPGRSGFVTNTSISKGTNSTAPSTRTGD